MMPQEKLDRFPQCRFPEFCYRLRVFFHRHMQGITTHQNPPRRDEAFQLRRGH